MPCSDLGACNHNAAAGIRTLEQDTKKIDKFVIKHIIPKRITAGWDWNGWLLEKYDRWEILLFHSCLFRIRIFRGIHSAWSPKPLKDSCATFLGNVEKHQPSVTPQETWTLKNGGQWMLMPVEESVWSVPVAGLQLLMFWDPGERHSALSRLFEVTDTASRGKYQHSS